MLMRASCGWPNAQSNFRGFTMCLTPCQIAITPLGDAFVKVLTNQTLLCVPSQGDATELAVPRSAPDHNGAVREALVAKAVYRKDAVTADRHLQKDTACPTERERVSAAGQCSYRSSQLAASSTESCLGFTYTIRMNRRPCCMLL
jgi:hypothetical protein